MPNLETEAKKIADTAVADAGQVAKTVSADASKVKTFWQAYGVYVAFVAGLVIGYVVHR